MDRRKPGTGSKVEIAPGVWRLFEPGGDDLVTGKRHRPSHTFYGDEDAADRELDRLCALAGHGDGTSSELWEFIEGFYLPAIQPPELKRRTVDSYTDWLTRYVKPAAIARKRMDRLTRLDFVLWMKSVKAQVKNKQTQLHIYSALSAVLGRAVRWGLIEENLLRKAVDAPVPDLHYPVVLSEDEANDYLDAFEGHELEPLVVLQIAAGLRPEEVQAVEWRHIDFEDASVFIELTRQQRKGEVWTDNTKSRESKRPVPLPEWAIERLRRHRGIGRVVGELTPNQIRWRYKSHALKSGLPWCPMENLRHTHATIGVERGITDADMAARLGHTSVKMVRERYVKRRVMRARRAAEVIEGFRRPSQTEPQAVSEPSGATGNP